MNTQGAARLAAPGQFHPIYPPEHLVVDTNLGQAGYINGCWFHWWPNAGDGKFARIAHKGEEVIWWKSEDGVTHRLVPPEPQVPVRVRIGQRKYGPTGWTRKDEMYAGDTLIGIAKKSQNDVRGHTICMTNSAQTVGWQPMWCLEQHLATIRSRS